MNTVISSLCKNVRFNDTVAMARGAYKVTEAMFNVQPRKSSWMDPPPQTNNTTVRD